MPPQTAPISNEIPSWTPCAALAGWSLAALLAVAILWGQPAHAQNIAKPTQEAAPQAVPGFWDPRRRPDRPDLSRLTVIHFLTKTDYPRSEERRVGKECRSRW